MAKAHIRAAFIAEANGKRHIITSSKRLIKMRIIADILNNEFAPKGYEITREEDPSGEDPNIQFDNSRMINVLQITPTTLKKTIIDMAYSLIRNGTVKIHM